MRLRDRRRKNRGVYRAEARMMATLSRLERWPHRYRWRAIARARAREPVEFLVSGYPVFVFGNGPARLGSYSIA